MEQNGIKPVKCGRLAQENRTINCTLPGNLYPFGMCFFTRCLLPRNVGSHSHGPIYLQLLLLDLKKIRCRRDTMYVCAISMMLCIGIRKRKKNNVVISDNTPFADLARNKINERS